MRFFPVTMLLLHIFASFCLCDNIVSVELNLRELQAVPADWKCDPAEFGDGKCDCKCGASDIDCAPEDNTTSDCIDVCVDGECFIRSDDGKLLNQKKFFGIFFSLFGCAGLCIILDQILKCFGLQGLLHGGKRRGKNTQGGILDGNMLGGNVPMDKLTGVAGGMIIGTAAAGAAQYMMANQNQNQNQNGFNSQYNPGGYYPPQGQGMMPMQGQGMMPMQPHEMYHPVHQQYQYPGQQPQQAPYQYPGQPLPQPPYQNPYPMSAAPLPTANGTKQAHQHKALDSI